MLRLKICDSAPGTEKKKKTRIFIAIFSKTLFSRYSFQESKFSRGTDEKGWEITTRKGNKNDFWKSKGSALQHHKLPAGQVKQRGSQERAQARCEAVFK